MSSLSDGEREPCSMANSRGSAFCSGVRVGTVGVDVLVVADNEDVGVEVEDALLDLEVVERAAVKHFVTVLCWGVPRKFARQIADAPSRRVIMDEFRTSLAHVGALRVLQSYSTSSPAGH